MISVKSNIKGFIENYKKKVANLNIVLNNIANKLAEKMSTDMKSLIQTDSKWKEHGNLSKINNVDFRIEPISQNSVRVHIGEKLPKFEMSDGTLVNPAFFIEFGFGIIGQNSPKQGAEKHDWQYNIRGHKDAWYFWYEGVLMESEGREGINFMYNTIQRYKDNWQNYLKELLKENANG